MFLTKTNVALANSALPTYAPSAAETGIFGIPGLSCWLESPAKFCQKNADGSFRSWVDRVGGRRFIPALTDAPSIVTQGESSALRFGYSGVPVAPLISEDSAGDISMTGFTVAALVHNPVSGVTSYGGAFLASRSTHFAALFKAYGSNLVRWSQDATAGSPVGAFCTDSDLESASAFDIFVVSYDFATKAMVLKRNGVTKSSITAGSEITTETGSTQMMIGAGKDATQYVFTGDIAAILVFKDIALHLTANATLLNYVETHLGTLQAALAA